MQKLTINRKELIDEISFLKEVASGESTSHLSKNILFVFSKDKLEMKAANVFTKAKTEMKIDNDEEFYFAVNSDKIFSFISQFKTDTINLSVTGTKVKFSSGRSNTTLNSDQSAKDILNFNYDLEIEKEFSLNADNLKRILILGDKFVSKKDTIQYSLRSFFVDIKNSMLTLTSMQENRMLSYVSKDESVDKTLEHRLVFDGRSVDSILSCLNTEKVYIYEANNLTKFTSGVRDIYVSKQAIKVPKFEDILQQIITLDKYSVEFDAESFTDTLKRIQNMVDRIPVKLDITSNKITLSISDMTQGIDSIIEEIDAETSDKDRSYQIVTKYLIDFVSLISGNCKLHYSDENKPLLLSFENMKYVVSPIVSKSK